MHAPEEGSQTSPPVQGVWLQSVRADPLHTGLLPEA